MVHRFNKRILKEIQNLYKSNQKDIRLIIKDTEEEEKDTNSCDRDTNSVEKDLIDSNILKEFMIEIIGAEETVYEGEKYLLRFRIPKNYPIEAPEVVFVGRIPINEHVYSNGHICLSILYDYWSPALTIESICISIVSLLSSAKKKIKPPNDDGYCRLSKNKSPKDFKWSYHN